jgi:hypothetical protein
MCIRDSHYTGECIEKVYSSWWETEDNYHYLHGGNGL